MPSGTSFSSLKFRGTLALGALLACVLCVQCVRTYLYTDSVLVPQQAQRDAERQLGALTSAARSANVADAPSMGTVMQHALEAAQGRVLWMRLVNADGETLAHSGKVENAAPVPRRWFETLERHETLGNIVNSATAGKTLVTLLPFRLPRPPGGAPSEMNGPHHHPAPLLLELAIPLDSAASAFDGLRQNLIVGLLASIALLAAISVIAFRARHYFRGQYLQNEMRLAKRVQTDLLPKPSFVSPHLDFSAVAKAADEVGGDFYDIFETAGGEIDIVLGDVSGKGIPAALLASVLQGAIRSANTQRHETACARINNMLCERTARERYATLFWAIYDPARGLLRYVNAGHAAPMLLRAADNRIDRLHEGGAVLGMLPNAHYTAGFLQMQPGDKLVLCSDGINEAANAREEEFGDDRLAQLLMRNRSTSPAGLCGQIHEAVTAFAGKDAPADDQTLLVVAFGQAAEESRKRVASIPEPVFSS